jgi:nitrate/TMAO reductase-like tetraheme cytochrome c subunit
VCHADKNIRTVKNGQVVSLYVDAAVLESSAHATLLCTDCHVDFAYKTPHPNASASENWRILAKSACKNCHRVEYLEWAKSAHSTANTPGATSTVGAVNSSAPGKPRPLCGDCHMGHSMPSKNDTEAQAALHASALTRCGDCHVLAASNYTDYYHGAAYRQGAPDAPACWQCHNTHFVLPSKDRSSWTNQDNLDTTCGQCHKAIGAAVAGPGYTQYAVLIHRQQAEVQSNPIVAMVNKATQTVGAAFDKVISTFRRKNGS